jgi:glycosyltransferase involved in cell wall biosynthesis
VIRDGIDGVLVRAVADANALATALAQLMSNEALRRQYAQRAPEVLERFSMDQIGQRWDALFKEIKEKR